MLVILTSPLFMGLTHYEATKYGSSILVCNNDYIRYWVSTTAVENGVTKYYVFDTMKRKRYPYESCAIVECSPNPVRFENCVIPEGPKRD